MFNGRNNIWGQNQILIEPFIDLGIPKTADELDLVKAENGEFGDVIINNIKDVYPHLALKTLSALDWFNQYCRQCRQFTNNCLRF